MILGLFKKKRAKITVIRKEKASTVKKTYGEEIESIIDDAISEYFNSVKRYKVGKAG